MIEIEKHLAEENEKKEKEARERLESEKRAKLAEEEAALRQHLLNKRIEEIERLRQEVEIFDVAELNCSVLNNNKKHAWTLDKALVCTVNTFLTEHSDKTVTDLDEVLLICNKAEDFVRCFDQVLGTSIGVGDMDTVFICKEIQDQLRNFSMLQIDRATANMLTFWDIATQSQSSMDIDKISKKQGNLIFGVWCNTSIKMFRMKTIEFSQSFMSTDIPRPLSTARIAVRNLFYPYSQIPTQYSNRQEFLNDEISTHMVLGGIFALEILNLPPALRKMNEWVFRPVGEMALNISRQTYPLDGGNLAGAPVLRAKFTLPECILLPEIPVVRVWNSATRAWDENGIGEVDIDRNTQIVRFHTEKIGYFAVLQDRSIDLPYASWRIRPIFNSYMEDLEVSFELHLPRLSLDIHVQGEYCWLYKTDIKQLQCFVSKRMIPGSLIMALQSVGIAASPLLRDASRVGLKVKESAFELYACFQVASICTAFEMKSSKWNQSLSSQRCMFQVRESSAFAGGNDDAIDIIDFRLALMEEDCVSETAQHNPNGEVIALPHIKCSIIQGLESIYGSENTLDLAVKNESHIRLLDCMKHTSTPESVARSEAIRDPFRSTVMQLLRLLRPFSFG